MMGKLGAMLAATAIAAIAAAAAPQAASAQSLGVRLKLVQPNYPNPSAVFDLVGLRIGSAIEKLVCPPASEVEKLLRGAPGLGQLAAAIQTGACAAGVLDFEFRMEVPRGSGQPNEVRTFAGILNVPTLMSVDDDPAPELSGTIRALSTEVVSVELDRVGNTGDRAPVRLEAILGDPSRGSLPRERIAVGYDAMASGAPHTWHTDLRLEDVFGDPDPVRLGVDVRTGGPRGPLATVAELYDRGPGGTRVDVIGGRLAFDPPPVRVTTDLALSESRNVVRVRSTQRSTLTAQARISEGDGQARVDATVDRLPNDFTVAFEEDADERIRVDYDATEEIERLTARYTERTGAPDFQAITQQANAELLGVPRGLTVRQTGEISGRVETRGGPIGSIEGSFARGGEPLRPLTNGHYVRVHQEGDFLSAGFRLLGVEFAEFDGTDPITLNARIAPGPFIAKIDTPDLDIDAAAQDLPSNLRLLVDTGDDMRITYDGAGEGIDELSLDIDSPKPLFARARHLSASIDDIPAQLQVDASLADGGVELRADNRVGAIEVAASSGPGEALPAGQQGLIFRDLEDRFVLFGRINAFKEVSFRPTPIDAHIEAADGGSFDLAASIRQSGEPLQVAGKISNLPRTIDLSVDDGEQGTQAVFNASEPVSRIALEGRGLTLLDRADNLSAEILSLPERLEVNLPESGPLFSAAASEPIGTLAVRLADAGYEQLPANRDGVVYLDTLDRFAVTGQISGLRGAMLSSDPVDVRLDIPAAPRPFAFDIRRQQFTDQTPDTFQGQIDRPQRDTRIQLDTDPETRLSYDAGGSIDLITLLSNVGSLGLLDVSLGNLPRELDVCVDTAVEDQQENVIEQGDGCRRPASPERSGDVVVSADINDNNTAHGDIVLNGTICPTPNSEALCRAGSGDIITLDNLALRNIAADVNSDGINSSAFLDTDNRGVTGAFSVRTSSVGLDYLTPAPGLRAEDRFVSVGDSSGTIACPPGTDINLTDPISVSLEGLLCP